MAMPVPPPSEGSITVHATALAAERAAVLLLGPSGAGKSDLALRALATSMSWLAPSPPELVADDRVQLDVRERALFASPPAPLRGLIEVRGLGIVPVSYRSDVRVVLAVALTPGRPPERMPPEPLPMERWLGVDVPRLTMDPWEPSAPIKLLIALKSFADGAVPLGRPVFDRT